ncbi:MarR family winged helix-turn-helix transcriptional regulator [Amnibacterium kyonggiense]|uniref:DNA-binding MarR family transcriptional regulator n=1 Tax=Amnibacterium kyonggiense TaxID=595671 RepID=A0A4V3EB65_9MICO|nr:MarR family transcriptional regulator [Amnibacterium kyonggiense]TDS80504.1 DNA-binding MarR family transcriptional regulator [Amnibacterium kyonggiense]
METPQDWPTGRLLSTAARLVEHAWAERLETVGLTHAGLIALHLLGDGARSQTDLARAARVQLQTMARTLERLERHGHVTRERDDADARRVLVSRTPAGAALLDEAQRLESEALPPVSDPAALRTLLLEVVRSASGGRFPAA